MAYQRVESALPYQYKEKERRDERMRSLLNMFMMQKRLGAERGEKEYERGVEEEERGRKFEHWGVLEELQRAQTERALRPQAPREPTIPAEIQAAREVEKITGEPVGVILNRWRGRKGAEPREPGIKKSRQKWLEGLDKTINDMIKGLQARPEYGMDEELTGQVTNLQQAKTKIRAGLLIGADQPLADTMWRDLGKISESLEQIQKVGLISPEKKPLVKAKLPRMKRSEVPPDIKIRWNPKYNIRMAEIDGVWHWITE